MAILGPADFKRDPWWPTGLQGRVAPGVLHTEGADILAIGVYLSCDSRELREQQMRSIAERIAAADLPTIVRLLHGQACRCPAGLHRHRHLRSHGGGGHLRGHGAATLPSCGTFPKLTPPIDWEVKWAEVYEAKTTEWDRALHEGDVGEAWRTWSDVVEESTGLEKQLCRRHLGTVLSQQERVWRRPDGSRQPVIARRLLRIQRRLHALQEQLDRGQPGGSGPWPLGRHDAVGGGSPHPGEAREDP